MFKCNVKGVVGSDELTLSFIWPIKKSHRDSKFHFQQRPGQDSRINNMVLKQYKTQSHIHLD